MPSLEGPLVKLILTVKACKTMQVTRTTSRGLLAKTTRKICQSLSRCMLQTVVVTIPIRFDSGNTRGSVTCTRVYARSTLHRFGQVFLTPAKQALSVQLGSEIMAYIFIPLFFYLYAVEKEVKKEKKKKSSKKLKRSQFKIEKK